MEKLRIKILLASVFCLFWNGCKSLPKKTFNSTSQVTIMAYNVENFFDTQDDPNKDDDTFLPLSLKKSSKHIEKCEKIDVPLWRNDCLNVDWNEDTLKIKMDRISQVIRQVNNGRGPDVLMLEEVENKDLLNRFNKEYLADLGYQTAILIEGWDDRAIDQAVLSRLPLSGEAKLHKIPLKANEPSRQEAVNNTRGILEVPLKLPNGDTLFIFGVHLPSGGPAHYLRLQAVNFLNSLQQSKNKDAIIVTGGDFNINTDEDTEYKMYAEKLGQFWQVSHIIGCKDCIGTHFYGKEKTWSFLDALLFSPSLAASSNSSKWRVVAEDIEVMNHHLLQMNNGKPARFNEGKGSKGISDHLPIFGVIELRN